MGWQYKFLNNNKHQNQNQKLMKFFIPQNRAGVPFLQTFIFCLNL